ncbi:MAG TPA: Ig-like domain repeat protein, partial [Bryobacteraceae bacterium]|nr:Ig-like domain repeat protein [Bryobacteraceae bacterium]
MKLRLDSLLVRSLTFLAVLPLCGWGQCPTAYTVSSTGDSSTSATTPGTLRYAVAQANNCHGSEIDFSLPYPATITLSTSAADPEIVISAAVTINGPGASNLTISGGGATRIFFVNPGNGVTVNINNVTLANGYGLGGSSQGGGGAAGMGGAIFQNSGTLNISNVVFSGNTALGGSSTAGNQGGGGFGGNAPSTLQGAGGGDLGGTGGNNAGGAGGPGAGGGGSTVGANGGNGGFGGGGGAGLMGANGGFGAGGGGTVYYTGNGGSGGFGAGNGSAAGAGVTGGGGAGFGGAIFAYAGNLSLSSVQFNSNTAAGGSGNQSSQGKGGALFVYVGANVTANNVTYGPNTAAQAGTASPNPYGGSSMYASNTTCPGEDDTNVCGIVGTDANDLVIYSGNYQAGATTRTLQQPFILRTAGNATSGNQITFTINADPITGAGGAFTPINGFPAPALSNNNTVAQVATDSNGYATSPQLIANNTPGSFTVTASDTNGGSVTFYAASTQCLAPSVTLTTDTGIAGELRYAVNNACAGSTIDLTGLNGTITLANGRLRIDDNLTINGPGASALAIDGGKTTRLFFIGNGSVAINNLTLQNGLGRGGATQWGGAGAGMGGAIFQNGGNLIVAGVTFSENQAQGGQSGAGGNFNGGGGLGGNASGYAQGGSGGDLFGINGGPGAGGGSTASSGIISQAGGFAGGGAANGVGGFGGGGGEGLNARDGGGFGGGSGQGNDTGPGGGGAGFGGAIFEYAGTLALANDTFSGDSAAGGSGHQNGQGKGGAIFIYSGAGATAGASDVTFGGSVAAEAGNPGTGSSLAPYSSGATCPGQDTVDICGVLDQISAPASESYGSIFTPTATTGATLSVQSGPCTISNGSVTVNGASGTTCVIQSTWSSGVTTTATIGISPQTPTIDVTSVSPASEFFGQNIPATITAVVAWSGSGAAPTGAVTISGTATGGTYSATSCGAASGNAIICTATFTPGAGTAGGTYTMSASIAADSNYNAASSPETNNFSIIPVPAANVCSSGQTTPAPCSATITLNYNIPPGTTLGATPVQVVTQGAPNLDFKPASTGTTCTASLAGPANCAVPVTFAPLAPGLRMGAVNLIGSSGTPVASSFIYGIGNGPAAAFSPVAAATLPVTGINGALGVAVDAAGDLFVADFVGGVLLKLPAGGGAQTTVASGLSNPDGVAVDGVGNVYVAEAGANRVTELLAAGGTVTYASGLSNPNGLAVDGAGDLFIAVHSGGAVVEVPAGGGAPATIASGLSAPGAVAVDPAGNVYFSDSGKVYKVPAGGGSPAEIIGGLNDVEGLAVDAAGNIFIGIAGAGNVIEVAAGSGAQTTLARGLYYPGGVALDGAGDVFIASGSTQVLEVQRSQAPSLSFASTNVSSTSSDSPQSVTIQNIGNQPLGAVSPGLAVTGPNFVKVAGSGTPADCTSSFALTPGASCNISISFEPQTAGPLTSTAVFTDNALNASPPASQSIALTGSATQQVPTINVTQVSPSSEVYGQNSAATVTAVLSWTGGGPAPTASNVTISTNTTGGTLSGVSCGSPSSNAITCIATYTPDGTTVEGTYTMSAAFSADSSYSSASSTQANNFSITQATSGVSVTSGLNPSFVGQQVTFTASISGEYGQVRRRNGISGPIRQSVPPGISGNVTWSANTGCGTTPVTVNLGAPSTASCITTSLPHGTDIITASYSGDSNHSGGMGTLSGGQVVNLAVTTIDVTSVNPASEFFGQDVPATITAVVAWSVGGAIPTGAVTIGGSATGGTYSATSCGAASGNTVTCTATFTPGASTAAGTYTMSASIAADSNYSAASNPETNNFSIIPVPTANVCPSGQATPAPCSYAITLNYNIPSGTTLGANPVQVVTQGGPNLDFKPASTGTTCTASLAGPANCAVQVTFAPLAPGLRMGAVNLIGSSGTPVASSFIYGIGNGPAIAFGPGVQTTLNVNVGGMGLNQPAGVAVDAAGDVFIADSGNNRVVELPAGGGPQTTVGSGLKQPSGVAVDGAGDVFIGDSGNSRMVEVPADGGPQTTVGSGLSGPQGVAVDGAGDVFIADYGNGRVVEVPAGGGPQTTVGSLVGVPESVAVDAAGDVFIAQNGGLVVEVRPSGVQTTLPVSVINHPTGVAVDGAGDVFVADTENGYLAELPYLGNGTYGAQMWIVQSSTDDPYGVAVDGAGDIFVSYSGNNQMVEFKRSQAPSLSFASTNVGSTSSDSPQSITIQNIGNQPLNAVSPGLVVTGPNFVKVAGSGTPPDCTSSFALTLGGICNLSMSFAPQSTGLLSSTAVFTDNALNASPSASQSIALAGTGTQTGTGTAITPNPASPIVSGQSESFTATVTPNPGTTGSTVNFTAGGISLAGCNAVPLTAGGTATCTTTALVASGSAYAIAAIYSGNSGYSGSTGNL